MNIRSPNERSGKLKNTKNMLQLYWTVVINYCCVKQDGIVNFYTFLNWKITNEKGLFVDKVLFLDAVSLTLILKQELYANPSGILLTEILQRQIDVKVCRTLY